MENVSDLNWEINVFLKNLRNYQSSANKANGTTVKLLTDTLRCVADFIGGAETIKAGNDKLFFDIDEDRFEFRRLILCRVCHLHFGLTREEYINHVTSERHNNAVAKEKNRFASCLSCKERSNQALSSHELSAPAPVPTEPSARPNRHSSSSGDSGSFEYPPRSQTNVSSSRPPNQSGDHVPKHNANNGKPRNPPNVFDENFFEIMDSSPDRSRSARRESFPKNVPSFNEKREVKKPLAPSPADGDQNFIPPYLQNSLYLASRTHRKDQNLEPELPKREAPSGPKSAQNPNAKLEKLFEDIKKKRESNARISSASECGDNRRDETRYPQRSSSITSNNAANKGAIPKTINRSTSLNSLSGVEAKSDPATTPAMTAFQDFFSRDLIPILTVMMDEGTQLRQKHYNDIKHDLTACLKQEFPLVKCIFYGSRMTGIADEKTRLNIYVDFDDTFNQEKPFQELIKSIKVAEKLLVANNSKWSKINRDGRTLRTVLSAVHSASKIQCDLTFGTGVAFDVTKVIEYFFRVQPSCRRLVMCIKMWFQQMPEESMKGISNYIITLLVIFFFQIKRKLPSVREMQIGFETVKCGENIVGFSSKANIALCSDRLLDILIEFFDYYAAFDFQKNIISPFEGVEVAHDIRTEPSVKLSPSLIKFKKFLTDYPELWTRGSKMSIQDIFIHKLNVAHSIHKSDIVRFQFYCKKSAEILRSIADDACY